MNAHPMITRSKSRLLQSLEKLPIPDPTPEEVIELQPIASETSGSTTTTTTTLGNVLEKRYIMIFDTETTGLLPKKQTEYKPYKLEFPLEILNREYPYITQLSYIIYDLKELKIKKSFNTYIKIPEEVELSEIVKRITGITREKCDSGMDIVDALNLFHDDWLKVDVIVAHNMYFDRNMINIECRRNVEKLPRYIGMTKMFYMYNNHVDVHCTMLNGMRYCSLKKFPRLAELYELLFEEDFEDYDVPLHNSLVDTIVCLRCYLAMSHEIHLSRKEFKKIIHDLF